jgi:hypothetical protein
MPSFDYLEIPTGPAAPGIATSFQLLAADPGAAVNGDVWYNTGLGRFRGKESGVNITFAAETVVNVALYPGANLGAKLQTAHDVSPVGSILDCKGLTGAQAITANVTFTKSMKVAFGPMDCSVSAGVSILFDGTGDLTGAVWSSVSGAGFRTRFLAAAGVSPVFRVAASAMRLENFNIEFQGANAANVGIYIDPVNFVRVTDIHLDHIRLIGVGQTGTAIKVGSAFIGTIKRCWIQLFNIGIHSEPYVLPETDLHDFTIESNRIHTCNTGIYFESCGDTYTSHNDIEGNLQYGIRIKDVGDYQSFGDRLENPFPALFQIKVEAPTVSFLRIFSFFGPQMPTYDPAHPSRNVDHGGDSATHVKIFGMSDGNGVTVSGAGTISFEDCERSGSAIDAGDTTKIYVRNKTSWLGSGYGYGSAASAFSKLAVTDLRTDLVAATYSGIEVTATSTPTADTGYFHNAITATSRSTAGHAFSVARLNGVFSQVINDSNGAVTLANGFDSRVTNTGSAVMATARGYSATITNSGVGSITTAYGVYVSAPVIGAGSIGSYYGVFIETPIGAGGNNAILTQGGTVTFNNQQGSYDFLVRTLSESPIFRIRGGSDDILIGANALSGDSKVSIYRSSTGTAGNLFTLRVNGFYDPSALTTAQHFPAFFRGEVTAANAQDLNVLGAQRNEVSHGGTGTVTTARIVSASNFIASTGGITALTGVYTKSTHSSTGIIANYTGFHVDAPDLSGGGSITNYIGYFVSAPTSGTYTSIEGLRINDPTGVTATTLMAIRTFGGNVVFNENGGAYFFRVETDTLTNALVVDGTNNSVAVGRTTNTTSFFGVTQPAATSGVKRMADFFAGAHTGLTASTEVHDVYFGLSRSVNWASGALATQRAFYIDAPTYSVTAGVSQVITTAATLVVSGAPVAAGDGTIITNSYAFWVQTGRIVADGGLLIGAEPTGVAGKVGYTNTVDNTANSSGVGTIKMKGATSRDSSGFLKILDGATPRLIPYFDAITG